MKRFIVLVLAFLVFVMLKAEQKTETKEACKCKEGEENCPCLAQDEIDKPKTSISGSKMVMKKPGLVVKVKHPIKQILIKHKVHIKKAQKLKLKLAHTARKVAKLEAIAAKAPPHVRKLILKEKVQAVKRVAVLKQALKKTQAQIRVLKTKISRAPIALRTRLVAQKRVFKGKCAELLREIAAAQARVDAIFRLSFDRSRLLCLLNSMSLVALFPFCHDMPLLFVSVLVLVWQLCTGHVALARNDPLPLERYTEY